MSRTQQLLNGMATAGMCLRLLLLSECTSTAEGMAACWQVKKWRRELHRWDPEEGEVAQPLVTSLPPPPPPPQPPPPGRGVRDMWRAGLPVDPTSASNAPSPAAQDAGRSGGQRSAGTSAGSGVHSSSGGAGSKRRLDEISEVDWQGRSSKTAPKIVLSR